MRTSKSNTISVTEYPQAPAMGEAQTVSLTADLRQKLFAVLINVLVIGELSVSMYFAHQAATRFTPVFFKIFFCLLLPTLVFAYVGRRALATKARV